MTKPDAALRDKMLVEVKHPEALKHHIPRHVKILTRVLDGKIPEVLIGWMVVTSCRHMLRCVYGTDMQAAIALRRASAADMQILIEIMKERAKKTRKKRASA